MTAKRIGICAPSTPLDREVAEQVRALTAAEFPGVELLFHDQCFETSGHFAGDDDRRTEVLVAMANDPDLDAIWFARGGYGAARIVERVVPQLGDAARTKIFLGYSDAGNLLGGLYKAGIGQPVHGPMPADMKREGGDAAVRRSLGWLAERDMSTLEPSLESGTAYAAFNLMTLSMMLGTSWMPDLAGHVLLVEEVSEHDYAFDRAMHHVCANLADAGLAGLRLGSVSDVPENDRPFGETHEAIAKRWCDEAGIAYLGRAAIGHDADNRIVPFGKY